MNCPKCKSEHINKNGTSRQGRQKYYCKDCGFNFEEGAKHEELQNKVGLSEAQLRAKHDLRFIITTKCNELKTGNYLTEAEFVQFCSIRQGVGYKAMLSHPDYDKYHGKAGGVTYWSHPESIKKLKDEGVLT